MTGFVALCVIGFVIVVLANVVKSNASFDRLLANGIPARGILLSVSSTGMKTGTAWRRFESRQVVIDIEIPGQEPYEVATTTIFPINLSRDVLPGATVELRVDRRNPNNVAIIGPGTGFVPAALRTS